SALTVNAVTSNDYLGRFFWKRERDCTAVASGVAHSRVPIAAAKFSLTSRSLPQKHLWVERTRVRFGLARSSTGASPRSAMGHEQTWRCRQERSALPSKPDIATVGRQFRLGPTTDNLSGLLYLPTHLLEWQTFRTWPVSV